MNKVSRLVMLISFAVVIISFWNRNTFPEKIEAVYQLNESPKQSPVKQPPFSVSYENVNYEVEPEYDYDLHGLVVSYRHHDGDSMLHKLWNDHLNVSDVCIIWGATALSSYLNKFDFWNGQFTCNFRTRDNLAWSSFNQQEISNNHLISDDEYIRKKINEIKIGDQIRIRGYLSSYATEGGGKRGTSTVRTDTGNGACETIFVKEFDIVKASNNPWRKSMHLSLLILVISVVAYFISPFRVS